MERVDDATLTLLVLAGTVVLFVLNKLPVSVIRWWIFIASLFVVAEGVDARKAC